MSQDSQAAITRIPLQSCALKQHVTRHAGGCQQQPSRRNQKRDE